jgi:hypothetical protein
LAIIAIFVTTKTYTQLAIASVLYAIFVYFVFEIISDKKMVKQYRPVVRPQPIVLEPETQNETFGINDIDKRAFLKLIGITSFSLFVFSLFNKRAEAAFLGGADTSSTFIKDSDGNNINPAEKQPTDGYQIAEIDDSEVTFYGFTNKEGAWFIMKEDTDSGSFRYIRGTINFPTYWSNRLKLKYDYYNNIF